MKIQLDTKNKVIKIESAVKLKELISVLQKLLPDNLWQQFTLEPNEVINHWTNPVIIERDPMTKYPQPYWKINTTGEVLCSDEGLEESTPVKSIYNLEI